jgi:hypothetical protein
MTDAQEQQEPSSLTGDIEPSEPGEWLTLEEAGARLGIDRKAVYRRIRRGKMLGKKAPHASYLLVWFPTQEPRSPPEEPSAEEEPRSLAVPDAPDRFAQLIAEANERATAPLVTRIEQLIRENEQLRQEREQRSRTWELPGWLRRLIGYN